MSEHDAIVIGAGPAGEVCAGSLAREGLDVALVERELIGGECAFWACMPSKALLRPAELLAEVERVPGAREAVTGRIDAGRRTGAPRRGHPRPRRLTSSSRGSRDRGIHLVRGRARLDGERRVRVGDELLHRPPGGRPRGRQRGGDPARSTGFGSSRPGPTARRRPPPPCPTR